MNRPDVAAPFPVQTVARLGGGTLTLGVPETAGNWQMIVVYRGLHCPICKTYAASMLDLAEGFADDGIEVVTVSGDGEEKARAFATEVGLTVPVGYGLTTDQMLAMGLYVSNPRDAQETDQPFSEPGMFMINDMGLLQVADISNAAWTRPDLAAVRRGIAFTREKGFPIRGTFSAN